MFLQYFSIYTYIKAVRLFVLNYVLLFFYYGVENPSTVLL